VASLVEIVKTTLKKIQGAPGKSLVATVNGIGGTAADMEVYSSPGVFGRPIAGTQNVELTVGGMKIIVASHNYSLQKDIDTGETVLYSMDSSGALCATVHCKVDGTIVVENQTESLRAIVSDLIDEIVAIQTIGSPANHTVSPASQTNLNAIKTRAESLLG
jgi:phage gp45-like